MEIVRTTLKRVDNRPEVASVQKCVHLEPFLSFLLAVEGGNSSH